MIPCDGFRPHPLTVGGHRQTLLGFWCRRHLRWPHASEDLIVDCGDDVRLLLRASWQPGPREARPALVLVHGLGGCDGSGYALATGAHAWALGWHVVRMNMRGAGDSAAVCAGLYNAGLDTDLLAALEAVARIAPRLALVGFSLGANLALLALGRNPSRVREPTMGAVAISPPLDLAACADALALPMNRLYQRYFVDGLRAAYRTRQQRRPDLYAAGRERGARSVREYDEAITAPYGGYGSADEYYARSSAGPHLAAIDRPTLILAALDDPMVPAETVARWPLPASGVVRREMVFTGGHVGFVAPTRAPGRFWAAESAMRFLTDLTVSASLPDRSTPAVEPRPRS